MPLPGFPALDVFVAVAKHRSFRKAALERGASPSALSHVIRGLEQTLGVSLFSRTNRSIRITAAGERLLARIGPALGEIAEAVAELGHYRAVPSGPLRLNVPRNAAEIVIKPILSRFLAAYPEVKLEVVTCDGIVDIVAEGFDAGIRATNLVAQDMITIPVGPKLRFAVVGSPDYLAQRGHPKTPADLQSHACIERRFPSGAVYPWLFARDGQAVEVEVSGPLAADDRALIIGAALDGVGLAHIHEILVREHLARGELVSVLDDWCPPLPSFHLYFPNRRQVSAPLRAFINTIQAGTAPNQAHRPSKTDQPVSSSATPAQSFLTAAATSAPRSVGTPQ